MYVCLCNGLTDKDFHQAIKTGARSRAAVYEACGCQPRCGQCTPLVDDMIRDSQQTSGATFKAA